MSNHLLCDENLPDVQPASPTAQSEAASSPTILSLVPALLGAPTAAGTHTIPFPAKNTSSEGSLIQQGAVILFFKTLMLLRLYPSLKHGVLRGC